MRINIKRRAERRQGFDDSNNNFQHILSQGAVQSSLILPKETG